MQHALCESTFQQAGRTALNWASWKGHTDIVHLLLLYKADVNAKGVVSECVYMTKIICTRQVLRYVRNYMLSLLV